MHGISVNELVDFIGAPGVTRLLTGHGERCDRIFGCAARSEEKQEVVDERSTTRSSQQSLGMVRKLSSVASRTTLRRANRQALQRATACAA
jgi:hypothetical protein